jgi:hypothetical protein
MQGKAIFTDHFGRECLFLSPHFNHNYHPLNLRHDGDGKQNVLAIILWSESVILTATDPRATTIIK